MTQVSESAGTTLSGLRERGDGSRARRGRERPKTPPSERTRAAELVTFGFVGVASTLAYAVLYLALRQVMDAFVANALALLLTAVANTAANRRLTFGVRGGSGVVGDHVVGLLAFGLGLALTTGSLALLRAVWDAGHGTELVVLTVANAMASLLRFGALRLRIGSRLADRLEGLR
jgi:putative flippase GtrA